MLSSSPATMNPAVLEGLGDSDGYKKRKRLTHLSPEERMMRRKLKNRVAAQTARDKKKARMDDLEHAVSLLEAENERLQQENLKLRHKSGTLAKENVTLKEKLGMVTPPCAEPGKVAESRESAVLIVPPQREQAQKLCSGTVHATTWLVAFSLMSLLGSSGSCRKQRRQWPRKRLQQSQRHNNSSQQLHRALRQWWGPQQQSWNPSKN